MSGDDHDDDDPASDYGWPPRGNSDAAPDPWEDGNRAAEQGVSWAGCPYRPSSPQAEEWRAGHLQFELEIERVLPWRMEERTLRMRAEVTADVQRDRPPDPTAILDDGWQPRLAAPKPDPTSVLEVEAARGELAMGLHKMTQQFFLVGEVMRAAGPLVSAMFVSAAEEIVVAAQLHRSTTRLSNKTA